MILAIGGRGGGEPVRVRGRPASTVHTGQQRAEQDDLLRRVERAVAAPVDVGLARPGGIAAPSRTWSAYERTWSETAPPSPVVCTVSTGDGVVPPTTV
ncbi:hypothetical protein [Amycolatopsis sp. cmx-11-51]|uniref:hypothetical protein n=1 Tax=unclassified Amycolatopsis TaxID=2618356 RepID=UPI0039E6B4A3